ncbi:MAG: LPS export ABC transporter permease LptG [Pseudomonadota bacterium]
MTIISRYLTREYLRVFAIISALFVMLYMLVDFFEKIDDLVEAKAIGCAIPYFAAKIPFVAIQITPVAVLMATIICLGILGRNNEITAMKGGGISLLRIAKPLLAISFVISILSLLCNESVVGILTAKSNIIWEANVDKRPRTLVYKYEQLWYKGKNSIYNITSYDSKKQTLEGLTINQFDDKFRLIRRIQAHSAYWKDNKWVFLRGAIKELDIKSGSYKVSYFDERPFLLPENPKEFEKAEQRSDELGFRELWKYSKKISDEGYNPTPYLVDMHVKLSFPFISFILSLIGIPIALRKAKGAGLLTGIGIGLFVVLAYLLVFVMAKTLGYTETIPPVLAAWFANCLFGGLGAFLLFFASREA